jgi:hypothetical protein
MVMERTTFSRRGIQDRGWEGRACLVRLQGFEVGQDARPSRQPDSSSALIVVGGI